MTILQIFSMAFLVAGFFGLTISLVSQPASPVPVPVQEISTVDSEVSDLIARLSPLSKEPYGPWYSTGLSITFRGRSGVDIELKTPSGDEYHGKASTLREAAKRITEPSNQIRDALKGWGEK